MQHMGLAMDVISLMDSYHDLFGPPPWRLELKAAAFGFRCGWGWFPLIKGLCANLRLVVQEDGLTLRIEAVQERFGLLRIQLSGGNDRVRLLLERTESASGWTCEGCGAPSEVANRSGWLTTLCDVCLQAPEVPGLWRERVLAPQLERRAATPLVPTRTVGQLAQDLGAILPADLPVVVAAPEGGRHRAIRAIDVVRVDLEPDRLEGIVPPHKGPGPDTRCVAAILLERGEP